MDFSSKEEMMLILGIDEEELKKDRARIIEKCFCAALCNQPVDTINKVLKDFVEIRDILYPKKDSPEHWDEADFTGG